MRVRKPTRKVAPPPPDVDALIKRITDAPDQDLVAVLHPVQIWKFARGDMHAWVPVTKRFIEILTRMRDSYSFGAGSSKPSKLQLNDFTPKDKELIREILRFIRLLMENCTNRKLFDGYEVLNDLLLTNDLDVLDAALLVLLRPLQQYLTQMPTSSELSSSIRQRLLALSRGWDRLHLANVSLVAYASQEGAIELSEEASHVQIQFYPPHDGLTLAESSPAKAAAVTRAPQDTPTRPTLATARSETRVPGATPLPAKVAGPPPVDSGMVTVDLGNVAESMSGDYVDNLGTTIDEHPMDVEDQLTALNKVRMVVLTKDRDTRRKMLTCRLTALACYSLFSSAEAVQSSIFLYEPELVNQIAELLVPGRNVGDNVVASAILALDSASRHRTEVLTSINAHVSHGIIMSLLRDVVFKLTHDEAVSHDVVDALLGFIAYINSLSLHGNLLVGAGLVQVLLELLQAKGDRKVLYIPRAAGLIDAAVFTHPQALQAFTNSDGINVLVARIKDEVATIIEEPVPEGDPLFSKESLINYDTNPLKSELRSIYRMLQSTGGADGFRNVVDSDLPKSLKRIFMSWEKFGLRNYGLAINIMATIVHNEPTSLSIVQEMQLPQTLYEELRKNMPDAFEVVYTLPNAIGAICLNQPGLQATLDNFDVITKIIKVAISWQSDEFQDRDHVSTIGSALDELVRHHPALRPKVLEAVLESMRKVSKYGAAFRPLEKDRNEYAALPASAETHVEMDVDDDDKPVDKEPAVEDKDKDKEGKDSKESVMPTNACLRRITNILKLLSGLLRNNTMARDFVQVGGLDVMLGFADLSCIPLRYMATETAGVFPNLLRIIGEHDPAQLLERLVASARAAMDAVPEIWKASDFHDTWAEMAKDNGPDAELKRARQTAGLALRLTFLSDYLHSLGSQRSTTALIKTLGASTGSSFVSDLGQLHRVAVLEHVLFKNTKAEKTEEESTAAPAADEASAESAAAVTEASTAAAVNAPAPAASTEASAPNDAADGDGVAESRNATPVPDTLKPRSHVEAIMSLATRLHGVLIRFFKGAIRLIFSKRFADPAHKPEAAVLADVIAEIIIATLQCSAQYPEKAALIDHATLGLAILLLFDERGAEGHLATSLFIPFEKKGGMGVLLDTVKRILHMMDGMPLIDENDRTAEQKEQWDQAITCMRTPIAVLAAFGSPRSLLESPQTHAIEQRESTLAANKRYSPVNEFIRIRRDVLPISHQVYMAPWLSKIPSHQLRQAVSSFLEMMAGKNEELEVTIAAPEPFEGITRPLPSAIARAPLTADPARVAQLVDMGFGRQAAERALVRARNNVAAAADLILSMPHLFPPEDDPAPAPAAEAEAPAAEAPAAEASSSEAPAAAAESTTDSSTAAAASSSTEVVPASTEPNRPTDDKTAEDNAKDGDMDVDPAPSPTTAWEANREELQKLRDGYKADLAARAMTLLDEVEDLVFSILPALPSGVEGAEFIIERLQEAIKESPQKEITISSRLRLLAVFARAANLIDLPAAEAESAMEILTSLKFDMSARPKWLAVYMLAAESILLMTYTIAEAKLGDDGNLVVVRSANFGETPSKLLALALDTLRANELSREEVMAAMRLVVILTRHNADLCTPELISPVLSIFKVANSKVAGCQPFLAMVMRHAFDSKDTLKEVMRSEIREWTTPSRNKVSDVNIFARNLRQMAYRDTETFIAAVQDECSLVDPGPAQSDYAKSVYHLRAKNTAKDGANAKDSKDTQDTKETAPQPVSSSDPFARSGADSFESHPVMDYLVSELGGTMRSIQAEEAAKRSGTAFSDTVGEAYSYAGLILSLITELVGSYFSAKKAFMASVRQGSLYGVGKGKSGIAVILSDLVCCVNLAYVQEKVGGSGGAAEIRRLILSSWATSLITALCANIGVTTDIKELPEDLVTVRKAVLDGVARALKDTANYPDPGSRYGRLWALGEVIYRLLTARPAAASRPGAPVDDSSLHLAKTMLEKNFVSLMTGAVSEIDLNYPDIRNVLVSLLKALGHLTKVSIKWGKANGKRKDGNDAMDEDDDETSDSDDDDMDMSEEREETPDLYRNSALGIFAGDIDVDDEDDDMDDMDDMDDDEEMVGDAIWEDLTREMEAFGDEMDHDMDDDDVTDPSDDDDDDDDEEEGSGLEGDWSTEDEGEGEDDEDAPVVDMGDDLEDMDEGVPWDEDGMMEGEMEEYDSEGEEEDGFMENDFGVGLDMDGDEDALEDFDDDEEGYDEHDFDMIEGPGMASSSGLREATGNWGWQEPVVRSSESRRNRGSMEDQAVQYLFGLPPRPSADNSQHPLLAGATGAAVPGRTASNPFGYPNNINDLIASIEGLGGPQAVQFLESMVHHSRHSGADRIRVDFAQRQDGGFGLSIGGRSFSVPGSSGPRALPSTAEEMQTEYKPRPTLQRWQDEQAVFPYTSPEQLGRIVVHLINRLLPAARKAAAEEAERLRVQEEKDKADAAKKREEDAQLATTVELPESRPESRPETALTNNDDVEMGSVHSGDDADTDSEDEEDEGSDDDVEVEVLEDGEGEGGEGGDGEGDGNGDGDGRVTINIHGDEIDITDTGIDLEFLQALPEDMRADVVEQHLREQNRLVRPAAAADVQASSQIEQEFLNALPPDIRREVMMQESLDRSRDQAPAPGGRLQAEYNAALASGPILGSTGARLHNLTSDMNDLMNNNGLLELLDPLGGRAPRMGIIPVPSSSVPAPPRPKRDAVQLLDKPGIASLVRVLFFPEALRKGYLFRVLVNLCENSKTRADLLNLLLSIVQDGSGDLPAVDRSFQQMSLRGLPATPKPTHTPKGKSVDTPAAPQLSGLFTHLQTDHIPTFIAQRCFEALSYIVGANNQAVNYFLTEHEQPVGLRKPPSKKGKGKEKFLPQTKFPIVILIGLLDRPALLKTPGMMESLTGLLAAITKPLTNLPNQLEAKQDQAEKPATAPLAIADNPAPASTASSQAVVPATPAQASTATETPGAPGPSTTAETSKDSSVLKAPVIPPTVIRLVVNCLTIGDCTSRTFSQTLQVLQNLSCIPEAKTVLVQELCVRSQALGLTLQEELKELGAVLATKDNEIKPSMLTKFSPAGSSQAQLLRLLKTIDYLHSRKNEPETKQSELTEDEKEAREIYQNFEFGSMWKQLSDCLTLAEERESTDEIAAVLLPLVEALMVVCKYTRSSAPGSDPMSPLSPLSPVLSPTNPTSAVAALSPTGTNTTPPPTDLFLAFTTRHRKVLNAIVRNNPSLMSGSFSLLINNPRVLEFDNKRNWFFQKLKRKREQQSYGALQLNIRRQYVFQDSYSALLHRPGDEIKYGKINVKFMNEEGVDAGGVTREWYHVLSQQIFDPGFALFEPCAADKQTYQPNKMSSINPDHLSFFKFVGRVIGKSIYDGRLLDAYFNRAFYKQILGRPVETRDLESIDPDFHKSLQWMLDNDITDVIDQEFTIEDDRFGAIQVVELKEGGAKIPVTEENKAEYVRLVCAYRLENSIKEQMNAFLTGFYEMIPRHLIQIFEPDQLELLISGLSTFDVDELKNSTQLQGWKSTDPEITWFWRALRSFSQEERSRFLMFVTSSSRVPLGGFAQLQGASGIQPFQIQKLYGKEGILPQASTCFNLLLLPKYASYEQTREKLLFAVTETSGFGKA